jgi:lipopolysaccharide transport system ATP-binding protein
MSDVIIAVENLGKRYSIRHERERYTALRDVIARRATAPLRALKSKLESGKEKTGNGVERLTSDLGPLTSGRTSKEDFWALRDVSFEVRRGEVLGIIGRNGAGKSTLLKILSRITEPTEGRVRIRGRVASLLEVGTGFHPELTGRENIYLNGAILGMTRAEIKAKFDEIVAFAETEKFLDTPVKRYSSGMYVRLAFAVAAHLEPEILVIDEVLAVGDAEFQKKCLGKMESVSKKEGRTVLFVSHNMGAIRALCGVTLLLASGAVQMIGETQSVTGSYLSRSAEGVSTDKLIASHRRRAGSGDVWISSVKTYNGNSELQDSFLIGEPILIRISYTVEKAARGTFFILIATDDGVTLISSFQRDNYAPLDLGRPGDITAELSELKLTPGGYRIAAGIFDTRNNFIEWAEDVGRFEVLPHFFEGGPFDHRLGFVTKEIAWRSWADRAEASD